MDRQKAIRRSDRQAERWKRKYRRQRELNSQIRAAAGDILYSHNFKSTKGYIQHGNMTVNRHCVNVAKYSLAFSDRLHIPCNRRELIRGALLHDYFLYDWHDPEHAGLHNLHGFYHPGIALRNALEEYPLTEREKDIIKKHMWPLTMVPPACREAWIVTAVDKWCSLLETIHIHKGHGVSINVEWEERMH
ncbi:MAG: phosphohydrolase [Roseburia sp.]|nr:phosphohydrolase [Roseburia sp.]